MRETTSLARFLIQALPKNLVLSKITKAIQFTSCKPQKYLRGKICCHGKHFCAKLTRVPNTRQKNMRSLLIFRNGEWLRNSTLNWRFPISENVRQIHCSPSVKLRKNTKFIASYPAPGKYQWIACSPERFSIVFPCARTRHFPSVFPQNN